MKIKEEDFMCLYFWEKGIFFYPNEVIKTLEEVEYGIAEDFIAFKNPLVREILSNTNIEIPPNTRKHTIIKDKEALKEIWGVLHRNVEYENEL